MGNRRTSVLIIQPEGTFNYNANLKGIAELLAENGYDVTIAARARDCNQSPWRDGIRTVLWGGLCGKLVSRVLRHLPVDAAGGFLLRRIVPALRADFYLGVDRDGIIIAATLAQFDQCPYALISYEITFAKETSEDAKKTEIEACKQLSFAVVQDPARGRKLAAENLIPSEKLIEIPVAGNGVQNGVKGALRKRLGIPAGKRIALYMGSVQPWAMMSDLVATVARWPDDWCLVIHNRFTQRPEWLAAPTPGTNEKLYLSIEPYDSIDDLGELLGDVDVGIALYKPLYTSPYLGENLATLGLASGKIATYFQYGIPVISNAIEPYLQLEGGKAVAHLVATPEEIPKCLARIPALSEESAQHCHAFFSRHLSLHLYTNLLLMSTASAIAGRIR
jgi:O-antigen biosynthesis protein